jgi:PAS domain S-box-containing protein
MSIRPIKIKTKIALFIIVMMTILISSSYFLRIRDYNQFFQREYSHKIEDMEGKFKNLQEEDEILLMASIDSFVEDQSFIDAFLDGNRDDLYLKTLPVFEKLKNKYDITHFYYHSLDETNFLRVHKKDIFGDKISRFTFDKAKQTKDIGKGIELGETAFALRVVKPYYNNNELIGYVEFGQEIDHFLGSLKEETKNEFFLIVNKVFIDHDKWKSVRNLSGLDDNWDEFSNHLIIDSTVESKSSLKDISKQCFDYQNRKSIEDDTLKKYRQEEKTFLCGSFPIYDAGERNIGLVISLIDITDSVLLENSFGKQAVVILLSFFVITFISFYSFSLRVMVRPIRKIVAMVNGLSKGNYLARIRVKTKDELGVLSSAVNEMADQVLESHTNLEDKVDEKTKNIFENKKRLEDQQKAILNILEDVEAERTLAKEQSRELEKFKLAVSQASDHIVITDSEGTVIYANDAVERITGFSKKEVLGKKAGAKDLWGGLMSADFYKIFWKTIKEDKKEFSGEVKNIRKDGRKYTALASVSPILDEKGNVIFFVGIERDITHEKEVDRMKTEFISLASHQLRTPLSAMNWFLEMLLDGDVGDLNKEQKEMIGNIDQSNQRMIALVNGLLNISRIESGRIIIEPKPTNLVELIKCVFLELEPKIKEKNITLNMDMDDAIGEISTDPSLTSEVFRNLATNAIKYSNNDGIIDVVLSKDGTDIIFKITDNGLGIPKKSQPKIFEKFHRATNAQKAETDGTGLGLYLAKAIVDSSNGKIWFESKEGKGTTFWFSLPISGMKAKKGEVHLDNVNVDSIKINKN